MDPRGTFSPHMTGVVALQTGRWDFHATSRDTSTDTPRWTWNSARGDGVQSHHPKAGRGNCTGMGSSTVTHSKLVVGFLTALLRNTAAPRPPWPRRHPDADNAQRVAAMTARLLLQGFLSTVVCCMELAERKRGEGEAQKRERESEGVRNRGRQTEREADRQTEADCVSGFPG